jgi:hypothetical protein
VRFQSGETCRVGLVLLCVSVCLYVFASRTEQNRKWIEGLLLLQIPFYLVK